MNTIFVLIVVNLLKDQDWSKKMKYIVTIEETCSQDFVVEADNIEEAKDIAIEKYNSGDFILDDPCLTEKLMSVRNDSNEEECTDWFEF